MHLFDLSSPLREILASLDNITIQPDVKFTGMAKVQTGTTPGGNPIFSSAYQMVTVDISNRVEKSFSVSLEKPFLPTDDEGSLMASALSLDFVNTDKHIAVTQTGAIIDPDSIEGGQIDIRARIISQSQSYYLNIYSGKIQGFPSEEFLRTKFELVDNMYSIIRKPVLYESFDITQNAGVTNGELFSVPYTVTQPDGFIDYHDGYITFAGDGSIITTFENSDADKVDLLDVIVKNRAKPGLYQIKFIGNFGFRLTNPDNSFLDGSTSVDFDSDYISILPGFWSLQSGITSLKGVTINFKVQPNMIGNPVTIAKKLIWNGITDGFGQLPNYSISQPVDWGRFNEVENRFQHFRIYLSDGNDSNSVWEKKSGDRPLSCLQLAQRALDHIGCTIIIDSYGNISITEPRLNGETVHPIQDNAFENFALKAMERENYLTINYGRNGNTGDYAAKWEQDFRTSQDTAINEVVINLPYYIHGWSFNQVNYLAEIFAAKLKMGYVVANGKLIAPFALSMIAGDKAQIITSKQPLINGYFEVTKIDKTVSFESASVELRRIPAPNGPVVELGTWNACADRLC